jgi:hypothetical protein
MTLNLQPAAKQYLQEATCPRVVGCVLPILSGTLAGTHLWIFGRYLHCGSTCSSLLGKQIAHMPLCETHTCEVSVTLFSVD